MEELRKKALRSYFSIRRIIDVGALTTSTILKLIDSLVKPVTMYACQVWLQDSALMKELTKEEPKDILKHAARDGFELVHLKLLKWTLGVHKKASNVCCYGDTGQLPWAITAIPQCMRYFNRVSLAAAGQGNVNSLIHHAYQEQKSLNLSWFKTWSRISENEDKVQPQSSGRHQSEYHKGLFIAHWEQSIQNQSKMAFYRHVKTHFGEEPYLSLKNRAHRSQISKLRSSSHDLLIEKGRYGAKSLHIANKACRFCCADDTLLHLEQLPFFDQSTIIESEEHVLTTCPMYNTLRSALSDNLKSLLMLKEYQTIMSSGHIREFGKYLHDCYNLRNPREKSSEHHMTPQ